MELKKNPKADLNRDSGLFFVIGLALVLFVVWRALEFKSYDTTTEEVIIAHTAESDLREEVPVTEILNVPPPPAPPAAPAIIEVVEDVSDIEETVIQSTEINQETIIDDAVVSVDEIEVEEEEEEITVPFAVIENIPVFPGCEQGSDAEKRACFQQKVQEHINKNFQYPPIALEMGIQGKVYVQFVINTEGHVTNIRTRGPDKLLEQEAERIIAALPKMTPGKQRGRAVNVPYSIPVTFRLL
ncbi:energy transducer TonB [Kriegella aquimaris]|uniref:Outer membrane transport energization protein TonB n=1 Tax=Kriegella aquimaris TaxID=192904 RepID=A0A1G9URN2_9FLAO|nr:energy transducer TonB [Kriegella aquimaris]SDM62467.1 outer membrane transport energization protein TonB [Kriegella aquimaris]